MFKKDEPIFLHDYDDNVTLARFVSYTHDMTFSKVVVLGLVRGKLKKITVRALTSKLSHRF